MSDSATLAHDDLLRQADELLASGDRPGAIRTLEGRMAQDPTDEETALLVAKLSLDGNDFARAAELALRALRIRPFHPAAMNLLGVACLDGGHPELAERLLRRVSRMAPGLRSARRNLKIARAESRKARGKTAGTAMPAALDRDAIREQLALDGRRLSLCTVYRDPIDAEAAPRVESSFELHEVRIVDATPGGIPDDAIAAPWTMLRTRPSADRSTAWNVAIRGATGDWVLVLEPGERLSGESCGRLRRALSDPQALAHAVTVRTHDGSERREIRLFRNAPGVHYQGAGLPRVHPSLDRLAEAWKVDLGRRVRIVVESERTSRYWSLPEEGRPDGLIELALAALGAGSPQQSLELLASWKDGDGAVAGDRWGIAEEEIATIEGRCLMRLERFDELERRMRQYHRRFRPTPNTRFLAGLALRASGDADRAVRQLRQAQESEHEAGFVPAIPERTGAGLFNVLGAALMDLGRLDDAATIFEAALQQRPEALEPRLGLTGIQLARGEVRAFLRQLDELAGIHGDDKTVWTFGASLLGRLPDLAPVASEWLDEACRRFPSDAQLRQARGEARLLIGDGAAALGSLDAETSDPDRLAARVAAALSSGAEIPPIPESIREQVERGVLGWMQSWMQGSAVDSLDRALVDIVRASRELPGLAERTAGWLHGIGQSEAAQLVRSRTPDATSTS